MDAYTRQPIWFGVSLTRTTANALRFLQRLRRRCRGNQDIFTDGGPWWRYSVVCWSGLPKPRLPDLRVEKLR